MARFHVAILLLVAVVGSIQCCDHETKAVTELEAKELGNIDCYGLPDGNFPDPVDSRHFWLCLDGLAIYRTCPANTYFSKKARKCVSGEVGSIDCYGLPDGNFPDPVDSRHFWQCLDGLAIYRTCPANTYFSKKARKCVSGEVGSIDCYGLPDGNFPDPVDSRHFWQCLDGLAIYRTCPANTYFSKKARKCVSGEVEAQCAEKLKASLKLKDILKA